MIIPLSDLKKIEHITNKDGFMFLYESPYYINPFICATLPSSNVVTAYSTTKKIDNYNPNVVINTSANDVEVYNEGYKAVIKGGEGKNYIHNYIGGDNSEIYTGGGKDVVWNQSNSVKIIAESGNNSIKNVIYNGEKFLPTSNVKITTGTGDDIVDHFGNSSVIKTGAGDDKISIIGGNDILVQSGDDNDEIHAVSNGDVGTNSSLTVDTGDGKNIVSVGSAWQYVTIQGGNDADFIVNDANNGNIFGGEGLDVITNTGDYTNIFGGQDGDIIKNYGNHVYIGGDNARRGEVRPGNDYINTYDGEDVTIVGGEGDDIIEAWHDIRTSILGGDGNDFIHLYRVSKTDFDNIAGDAGKAALFKFLGLFKTLEPILNKVQNFELGVNLGLFLCTWDPKYLNEAVQGVISFATDMIGEREKLAGFFGLVPLFGDLINIGKLGNNIDKLVSPITTVIGGKGDDVILNDGFAPRIFEYSSGDGNDIIHYLTISKAMALNHGWNVDALMQSTIFLRDSNISKVDVNDSNVTLTIGDGSIKLTDAEDGKFILRESDGKESTVSYSKDEKIGRVICTIYRNPKDKKIQDTVNPKTMNYIIQSEYGCESGKLYGGSQADTIYSMCHDTVCGEDGSDLIVHKQGSGSIQGGKGNDIINLYGPAGNNIVHYNVDDGDDIIYGFRGTDTLKILGSTYETVKSGYDIIVKVWDGSITIKDGAFVRVHIGGTKDSELWPMDFGSLGIEIDDQNTLKLSGDFKGKQIDVNDFEEPVGEVDVSAVSEGVEVIGNKNVNNYQGSNGSDVFYMTSDVKVIYHVPKVTYQDIQIKFKDVVTPSTVTEDYYTESSSMAYYDIAESRQTSGETIVVTVEAGGGDDIIYGDDERQKLYVYNAGDGYDTIVGFSENDTLNIVNGSYSTVKSEDDLIVKIGSGSVTLKDVSSANIIADKPISWTFKTLGSTVTATGKINGKVVATITGLKKGATAENLSVNGGVISIAKHALGTSNVAITGKYTLSVADNITQPIITPAGWLVSGTTATYKSENKTSYYTLASNKKSVIYKKAVASKNLVTVTGLNSGVSADDLTLSGKNVTVSANALGTSKVSISSGYNLVLGSDVTKSQTIAAGWNISGNTATYKTKEITAGYVLASNKKSVTYNSASGGDVLTTVTGLKSDTVAKNIPINTKTKTVTLNKAALDTGTVSVSGDYKLALGSDVKNKSKTTAAHFEVSGTTAKYVSTKITAGYSLATDKKSVSYVSATTGGDTLATITGLKKGTKATALSVSDNNVITISKAALAGKTITVSNGYTLALAKNVSAPVFTAAGWSVSGTTAKYNSEKIVAGYTLADDKKSVNYTKSLASKTLVTVTGLISGTTADKLSLKDNTVTLSGEIIGSKGATVNGKGYKFVLSSSGKITNVASSTSLTGSSGNDTLIGSKYADYISSGLDGSDYISGGGGNDTLLGLSGNCTLLGGNGNDYLSCDLEGNGSLVGGNGNDTLSACQGNITLAGGKGNDIFEFVLNDNKNFNATITDYTVGQNKILLNSSVSISSTHVSGNDVILNVSNSTITLKNAKGRKITFVDENGKTTSNTYSKSSSSNVSELWFTADDTNFSTSFEQIDSITQNGLSDYSLGNVDANTDWTALTPTDSLTSALTFSDK